MLRCLRHSRHASDLSTARMRPHPVHSPAGYLSRHALHPGQTQPYVRVTPQPQQSGHESTMTS